MSFHDDGGLTKRSLTLRDYFAAKILQGMLAGCDTEVVDCGNANNREKELEWARGAYSMADAMLEARKQ